MTRPAEFNLSGPHIQQYTGNLKLVVWCFVDESWHEGKEEHVGILAAVLGPESAFETMGQQKGKVFPLGGAEFIPPQCGFDNSDSVMPEPLARTDVRTRSPIGKPLIGDH